MSLTFLAFTDLHHAPQFFAHDAVSHLNTIMKRATEAKASFAVQLGDFLHMPEQNRALADTYNDAAIPVYNVFGNHDTDQEDYRYILDMYRLKSGYYSFDRDGYRFIVLDPNYSTIDGRITHYCPGQERDHNLGQIPQDQLEWIERTVAQSPHPCVFFSHQSLERTDGIRNRDDVWRIICKENRKNQHKVILCVNGHYHCDYCSFVNSVCCLDLNSSSYYWTDPENSLYPDYIYMNHPLSSHCLYYRDPLSALITLRGTNSIAVSGTSSEYSYPVTDKEIMRLDQRRLSDNRVNTPYISNYYIDLKDQTVERSVN